MHPKVILAVFTALLQLTSAHLPLTSNQNLRCGKEHKNHKCPAQMCCSVAGYCGTTEAYCSVPGNCQEKFGMCDSNKTPKGPSPADFKRIYDNRIPAVIKQCKKPRTLALTFDDGPAARTHEILDVLAEYDARGTFFLGGNFNGRGSIDEGWTPVVKRMIMEGHQIGSHTWSHPNMSAISSHERKVQMQKTERAILNVVGKMPTFMRAPMVACNRSCRKDMNKLGYHVVN